MDAIQPPNRDVRLHFYMGTICPYVTSKQVKKYQNKFGDSVRKARVVGDVSVVPAWKFLLGEGGFSQRPHFRKTGHQEDVRSFFSFKSDYFFVE